LTLPKIPSYATNNAHMYYLITKDLGERSRLIEHLKKDNVNAVFHYLSLHKSPYYKDKHDGRELPMSDFFSDTLVRLPLFYELKNEEVQQIIDSIQNFYK
jgi:dTDP-4-amino-4,6-dideoxygalactose transaminase